MRLFKIILFLCALFVLSISPIWARFGPDFSAADIPAQAADIQYQAVPAASFIHAGDTLTTTNDANNWRFVFNGGYLTSASSTEKVCLAAPVYLEACSRLQSFVVYVADNSTGDNLTVRLDQVSLLGDWEGRATIQTVGSISSIQELSETLDEEYTVSDSANYHVSFCLPAGSEDSIRFYGARVGYRPPINRLYIPSVMKLLPPTPDPTPEPTPIPPTNLLITNETGGSVDYVVYDTPQGDITCNTIPDGAIQQSCGYTFTHGTYSYKATAHCGSKVSERYYQPGDDVLTPFRCQ